MHRIFKLDAAFIYILFLTNIQSEGGGVGGGGGGAVISSDFSEGDCTTVQCFYLLIRAPDVWCNRDYLFNYA